MSKPSDRILSMTIASTLPVSPPKQHSIQNPLALYLASISPRSRTTMIERLNAVARAMDTELDEMDWGSLRDYHVEWIRETLLERGTAISTVNVTLSALKGIAKRARNLSLMTSEEYDRIRDVRGVSGHTEPAGRSASSGELAALVAACQRDRSTAGIRDAAIFAALYIGGVRRAELVNLEITDYIEQPPTLVVRRGKNRKDRRLPLTESARDAISEWIRIRGDSPGKLFVPVLKSGKIKLTGMSPHALYGILTKRTQQAGVDKLAPHDFRRTFIGDLLDRGVDIARAKEMAGHSSVETTARYDRRPEADRRRSVQVLHYPYSKRPGR